MHLSSADKTERTRNIGAWKRNSNTTSTKRKPKTDTYYQQSSSHVLCFCFCVWRVWHGPQGPMTTFDDNLTNGLRRALLLKYPAAEVAAYILCFVCFVCTTVRIRDTRRAVQTRKKRKSTIIYKIQVKETPGTRRTWCDAGPRQPAARNTATISRKPKTSNK